MTPDTIPIEGNARVEGKAGGLTMSWASFGAVTDAHFAAPEAPLRLLLADDGQMRTMAWTLAQVADGLARQGQRFRFHSDERPGHPDQLVTAVLEPAGLAETERYVLMRSKVAVPDEGSAGADTDGPEVAILDVITDNAPWLDLYRDVLASIPQRGLTTEDGVRRQVEDTAMARPLFLGMNDPDEPERLVGAVTATAVASTPGAPPVGELSLLAVRTDWRRRGLGTALVRTALGHLADAGVRTAITYVDADNQAALAFFGRRGFQERGARVYYETTTD